VFSVRQYDARLENALASEHAGEPMKAIINPKAVFFRDGEFGTEAKHKRAALYRAFAFAGTTFKDRDSAY
jgi:hypothetical protein